eukprot:TRINITY_DN1748_c2_g1_i2.p1 TRINITY_DN1748_c2_g1~~TRINITY_DN1748_c2_g1_i2.p1  ORF type:complete len:3417 (+),score=716.50 TRINITY_DN1748_c2_g1_i2:301-10551(+)
MQRPTTGGCAPSPAPKQGVGARLGMFRPPQQVGRPSEVGAAGQAREPPPRLVAPDDGFSAMPPWQKQQYKTFLAWVNYNLNPADAADTTELEHLSTAFYDGLQLVKLLENLSGEKIKGINYTPKLRIHYINNLAACFHFIKAIPLVLENISPEDISDGTIKLILGFLWVAIQHYQVAGAKVTNASEAKEGEGPGDDDSDDEGEGMEPSIPAGAAAVAALSGEGDASQSASSGQSAAGGSAGGAGAGAAQSPLKSTLKPFAGTASRKPGSTRRAAAGADPKKHLLNAVNEHCADLPPGLRREVTNFTSDWADGYNFLQLLAAKDPGSIDLEGAKSRSALDNMNEAFKIFKNDWAVPSMLDPEDLIGARPDDKAVMTYVSMALENMDKNKGNRGREVSRQVRREDRAGRKSSKGLKKSNADKGQSADSSKQSKDLKRSAGSDEPTRAIPAVVTTVPDATKAPASVAPQTDGQKVPLTVRVAAARDLNNPKSGTKPNAYVVLSVPSKQTKKLHKTDTVEGNRNPEWNKEFNLDDEDINDNDTLRFFVFSDEKGDKDTPIGVTDIPVHKLRNGIEDLWLPIRSTTPGSDEDLGELHITTAPGVKAKLPPIVGETMVLRLCSARSLASPEKNCDPYVTIEIDGSKRRPRRTKTAKSTVHPVWNKKYYFVRNEVNESDTLTFDVYDWKRVGKDDKLGKLSLPVKNFATAPDGVYDEWVHLGKGDGNLHVQAAWGKASLPPKPTGLPLVVRVAKATHLKAADRSGYSDPYCQVSVVGHKSSKANKTRAIKGCLNPEWNEEFLFEGQAGPEDALRFDIFDQDRLSLRPRVLGTVVLPLNELEASPLLDKWLPLANANKKKKGQGDLHVQLAYDNATLPPVPSGLTLQVRVGSARDIKAADKTGLSDPYVSLKLHGKRLRPKKCTKVVKRTLNPEWNEEFSFDRGEVDVDVDTARFTVYDYDRIARSEPLGVVDVPLKELKTKPLLDVWLPIMSTASGKERGEGELHLAFAWGDNVSLPPIGASLSVRVDEGHDLAGQNTYAVVEFVGPKVRNRKRANRTKIVKGNPNPVWYDDFDFNSDEFNLDTDAVKLTLYDYAKNQKHNPLGQVVIPLKDLKNKPVFEATVPVMDSRDASKKATGQVKLAIAYGNSDLPPVSRSKPVRVRVVGVTGLAKPVDPYTVVKISGKKADKVFKTGVQRKTADPDWNSEFNFKAGELDPRRDALRFVIKDHKDLLKDAAMGDAEVKLVPLLSQPSMDVYLPLQPSKKSKLTGEQGLLHVQIVSGDASFPKTGERLTLQIVGARNLKAVDRGGYSDPYIVIQRPNNPFQRRRKTDIKKNTIHPVWNEQFDFDEGFINPKKDVLSFELYDWDRLGKDDPLGYVQVNVSDFGVNKLYDQWLPINDFKARDKKGEGELHIQAVYGDLPLWFASGKGVRVRVAEARKLPPTDKFGHSEAFATIEVQGKKLRKMKTKTVKQNYEPVFNEEFTLPGSKIMIQQDTLQVRIYEHSSSAFGRKTLVGFCDLALSNLSIDKPVYDIWLPLYKDDKKRETTPGEVHLILAIEGIKLPPASREFAVVVLQGRNLLANSSGSADPYVLIKVPGRKTQRRLKTLTAKKTLNPVWNKVFMFNTQFFGEDDGFRFNVRDRGLIGKGTRMGYAEIQTAEALEQPFTDLWIPLKSSDKGEAATGDVRIAFAIGADGMKQLEDLLLKESNPKSKRVLPPRTNLRPLAFDEFDDDSDSDSDSETDSDDDMSRDAGKKVALKLCIAGARELSPEGVSTQPLVTVTVVGKKLKKEYKSKAAVDPANPEWNEQFDMMDEDIQEGDVLHFTFYDGSKPLNSNSELGTSYMNVKGLVKTLKTVEDLWVPVATKGTRGEDQEEAEFHLITANGTKTKLPVIKGEPLALRICGARNLAGADRSGLSDPYVEFRIKDSKRRPRKTKIRKATLHPVWNREFYYLRGEVKDTDVIEFSIFDWNRVGKDDKLGRVEIPVSDFVATPEFDDWLSVALGNGHLHIQAAWGAAHLPPRPSGLPMLVRVAKARHLKSANKSGYSDPYCQIIVAGRKAKRGNKTSAIRGTLNPEWNEEFLFEGDVAPLDALRFEVYDAPSVLSALARGRSLGFVNLPLAELEATPNIDTWLELRDPGSRRKDKGQGEVHIQIAYGENAKLPELPAGSPLTLRVVSARDLPSSDKSGSSDPYVRIKLKTKKLRRKMKTKVVHQSLNPEWNEEFSFERGEVSTDVDVLQFHVFDHDRLSRADPLAMCELSLKKLQSTPLLDVWLPSTTGEGQVHVTLAWGDARLPTLGAPFSVRVAEGRNLKPTTKAGGTACDPYAVVELVGPSVHARKNPFRTKVVKANVNPVWYDEFSFPRGEVNPNTDTLKLTLFDYEKGSTDVPLGEVMVPLKALSKTPVLEGLFPVIDVKDKSKSQGEVRLTIAFGDAELPPVAVGKPFMVRVVSASNVEGTNDPFVEVKIKGKKAGRKLRTPVQRHTSNPEWNTQFYFGPGELNAQTDSLRFVLKGEGELKYTTVGAAELPLLQLIATPVFDEELTVVAKGKKGDIPTKIRVQIGYGNVDLPKVGEKLALRVVCGRGLKSCNGSSYSDPYVIINRLGRPFARRVRTDIKKATVHPVWNEEFYFDEGAINKDKDVLSFEVFSWDRIGKDEHIGYVEVPMKSVVTNQIFDKWVPLSDPKAHDRKGQGELRLQAVYGDLPLPATLSGQGIRIRVGEGKGLLAVDKGGTSDPYCIVEVRGKKMRKMQTKVVKKNLAPVWNQEFQLAGDNVVLETDVVQINVIDWDRLGKTTSLGYVEYPLSKLLESPVQEVWLPVKNNKDQKGVGEIKIALALEGHSLPAAYDMFTLVVLEAKNLPVVGKATADPYCVVSVPGKKTATPLKTPTVQDSLSPVWNQEFLFNTTHFNTELDALRFDVLDWGVQAGGRQQKDGTNSNNMLGYAEVDVNDLFGNTFVDAWLPLFDDREEQTAGQLHILFAVGMEGEKRIKDILDAAASDVPGPFLPPSTNLSSRKHKDKTRDLEKSKGKGKEKDKPKKKKKSITSSAPSSPAGVPPLKKVAKEPKEASVSFSVLPPPSTSPRSPRSPHDLGPDTGAEMHTKIKVRIAEARDLKVADRGGTSDPYVLLEVVSHLQVAKRMKRRRFTKTIRKTLNPLWNEDFDLSQENIDPERDSLQFVVYDWVRIGDNTPMCGVKIPVRELISKPIFDEWIQLGEYDNMGKKGQGELHIVTAYDYVDLPDIAGQRAKTGLPISVRVAEARDLLQDMHPYVSLEVPRKKSAKRIKTAVSRRATEPIWDEDFNLSNEGVLATDNLRLIVHHHNHDFIGSPFTSDVQLGVVSIPVSQLQEEARDGPIDEWYKLQPAEGSKAAVKGELRLVIVIGSSLPEIQETRKGTQSRFKRRVDTTGPARLKGRDKTEKKKEKKKDKK